MRTDRLFLKDILCCCDEALAFVSGSTKSEFKSNDLLCSAVQFKLLVIGEAAARISKPFRLKHPEVAWDKIAAYRNFNIHGYFNVDWNRVWDTAEIHVPALRAAVDKILKEEFPD